MIVAAGLMYYNYIRFGSVTEFGAIYQMTSSNIGALKLLNPVSKIDRALFGIRMHLFAPLKYSAYFPFIEPYRERLSYTGFMYFDNIQGLINYPISWLLASLPFLKKDIRKESKILWNMILLMPLIGIFLIIVATNMGGVISRYLVDYMWMFILISLICVYFVHETLSRAPQIQTHVKNILCTMMAATIIVTLLTSITAGELNPLYELKPHIYYYLWDLFGIWF